MLVFEGSVVRLPMLGGIFRTTNCVKGRDMMERKILDRTVGAIRDTRVVEL